MPGTAHDYMNLYRNLPVPVADDAGNISKWQPVDIHKYLLANKDSAAGAAEHYNINNAAKGMGTLGSKVHDHFTQKKGPLKVSVGLSERYDCEFRSYNEAWYYAAKAFWGKACPEEFQITLQLAIRFGVTDLTGLQSYCDHATDGLAQGTVGLDCNGFVGNYLQHGFRNASWDDNKVGFRDYPANTGIADIMQKLGPEVKTMTDVSPLKTYVLGRVSPTSKRVINQKEGSVYAHIMITAPFTRPGIEAGKPVWILRVVESTHDAGLTETDYILTWKEPFIFNVDRGSKPVGDPNKNILVRLRPID
jgi:hypothetical protein